MHTLVIASQKGGSGKTTLSGHLAVEAEKAGAGPVALVDTDPQGSLSEWWNARESETPVFVKVGSLDVEAALAKLAEDGIKLAVVDTPPAITGAIASVVASADLVVIPTRPSPHDLRAVGATVDIADRFGKGVVFVVNDATARARITAETAVALSQHGVVAPVTIHNRVDFAASMIDGRTVGEVTPGSKSAEEVRGLWAYVATRLARVAPHVFAKGAATAPAKTDDAPATVDAAPAPVDAVTAPAPTVDTIPEPSPVAEIPATPGPLMAKLFPTAPAAVEPAKPVEQPNSSMLLPPMPDDDLFDIDPPSHPQYSFAPPPVDPAPADDAAPVQESEMPAPPLADRRSGEDRRDAVRTFGRDKRVAQPSFGKRNADRTAEKA